jgi:hypothetical protein
LPTSKAWPRLMVAVGRLLPSPLRLSGG